MLCLILLGAFSINVSAESSVGADYVYFKLVRKTGNDWGSAYSRTTECGFSSSVPVGEVSEITTTGNYGYPANTTYFSITDTLSVSNGIDGEILFKKGANTTVSIYNVYNRMGINHPNGFYYADNELNFNKVLIIYMDGSTKTITDDVTFTHNGALYDIEFEFEPKKDVKTVEVHTKRIHRLSSAVNSQVQVTVYGGQPTKKTTFKAVQSSEESGLLKGIIEWLKGIKDGITNLFDSIAELPSKLWQLISDGLKSLFMPSEDFIIQFKDDIDSILEEKLGAVYQVVNIMLESWDSITANDQSNTITIPQTTINLPQGNSFSFGGVSVPIVPNGFDFLATAIKTIVGIVCTIMAVNGLRKKYDEVMGVEQ